MTSDPVKILLIDGHEEDRAALSRCIGERAAKLQLFVAHNGTTGIEVFRALQPDVVVLELKMTDMIGMEVLSLIKTGEARMAGKPLSIFIWTNLHHHYLQTAALALGIQGYFKKSEGSERPLVEAICAATSIT